MKRISDNSVLTTVNGIDAENYEKVVRFLDYAALLPDDLEKLYQMHYKTIAPHLTTSSARVAGGLCVLCFKHLVLGTICLFRLYSAQSWRETRAAVEASGIAHAIQTNPNHFKIFSEDDGSEPARKRVKNTFKSSVLFPATIPELCVLKTYYDVASQLSHTNSITFVQHLSGTDRPGKQHFSFQDIQRNNISRDLPKLLFWMCQAHLGILVAADRVFNGLPANLAAFKKERADFFQRLNRFNEKHNNSLVLNATP